MEANKPIIDQMTQAVPSGADVTNAAKGFSESVTKSVSDAQAGVQSSLEDFSKSANLDNADSDFLSANGILAKFVFLLLVLVVFMILMKVGISVLGYMLGPWTNPYLVKGALSGSSTASIVQNPRNEDSSIILRSNDRTKGIEFTWSAWIFLDKSNTSTNSNIFVKGNEQFTSNINLLNGPGLYVKETSGIHELTVMMDTMDGREEANITGIPIQKWFHIAIRCQNKVIDTYINGVVTDRLNLSSLPKQNYNNVTIHGDGGYSGTTSNLRYYSYALNVFEINNIVMFGPDLSPSSLSSDSKALSGNYSYLANTWYGNNYNS